jgi:hypothetical protein
MSDPEKVAQIHPAPDPFDPASLRISQDYASLANVKKILTTVPVRKPGRQDYIRVHPSEDYRLSTTLLEFKEDRESYLVDPGIREDLFGELVPVTLFLAINRQMVLFLWPCRLPDETGRSNTWYESALDAADRAQHSWIRVTADMGLGAYQLYEAGGALPDPEWPAESMRDLLKIAFGNRHIDSHDHPALKRLRGEV